MSTQVKSAAYLDFYSHDPLVQKNEFRGAPADRSHPPSFEEVKERLPQPFWDGNVTAIDCYWKTWRLAFKNLKRVHSGNAFIAPFIDSAFNDCLFMWDSCFILLFARYGNRGFDFQRTLDNLYAKQHADGFISREIQEWDGQDRFHRYDPASTGPNVLAWCEWEYYLNFGNKERLQKVFPVLVAYHQWCRRHRTWPDGSYHSCGLACGMDNQPRVLSGDSAWTDHSYTAWIDATAQAILSARLLVLMASELGVQHTPEAEACRQEVTRLSHYVHEHMWHAGASTFADRRLRSSTSEEILSRTRSIGAYWTLLADVVTPERLGAFVSALDSPTLFNRPVRAPSLAANHESYHPSGGYWLGAVWPSTNYMLLRGLTYKGCDDIAADIGANYHSNVVACYALTGTVWENVAPEYQIVRDPRNGQETLGPAPGDPSKPDFVGWSGIGPIAVLFEYVFGIRANVPAAELVWDVRLLDRHGITNYPFGVSGIIDLECAARTTLDEEPKLTIRSSTPVTVILRWGKALSVIGGTHVERSAIPSRPLNEKIIHITAATLGTLSDAERRSAAGIAKALAASFGLTPASTIRNPNVVRVELTATQLAAVERLISMGFARNAVMEAFLACDKNEEAAANYLLENGG